MSFLVTFQCTWVQIEKPNGEMPHESIEFWNKKGSRGVWLEMNGGWYFLVWTKTLTHEKGNYALYENSY